jgi:dipeptidase E
MNLFFYSGETREQNHNLNLELTKVLSLDSTITYIPSSSEKTREHYKKFENWFGYYGYEDFSYFDLEDELNKTKISEVKNSDAIYLSGGNTFNFLYWLRKRGFIKLLREFVRGVKVLIGKSAGSYLMTPTVRLTKEYHEYKGDFEELNQGRIKRCNSLNLVNFEVIPHYNFKRDWAKKFLKRKGRDIYGICDGGGIIVSNGKKRLIGNVEKVG